MVSHTKWLCTSMVFLFMLISAVRVDGGGMNRVRSESGLLRAMMATAASQSQTFRSLLERIQESDVIVHVMCHRFDDRRLSGLTMLAYVHPGVRYLRVQVNCHQADLLLVAILAHELQHVVEIASSAFVVDEESFKRLFTAIGFQCRSPGREQFETMAAIEMGDRVRKEYTIQSKTKNAKHRPDVTANRTD